MISKTIILFSTSLVIILCLILYINDHYTKLLKAEQIKQELSRLKAVESHIEKDFLKMWLKEVNEISAVIHYKNGLDFQAINALIKSTLQFRKEFKLLLIDQPDLDEALYFYREEEVQEYYRKESPFYEKFFARINPEQWNLAEPYHYGLVIKINDMLSLLPITVTFQWSKEKIAFLKVYISLEEFFSELNDKDLYNNDIYIFDNEKIVFNNYQNDSYPFSLFKTDIHQISENNRSLRQEFIRKDGSEYIGFYKPLKTTDWNLVTLSTLITSKSNLTKIYPLQIILISVLLILSYLIYRIFINEGKKIKELLKQLSVGEDIEFNKTSHDFMLIKNKDVETILSDHQKRAALQTQFQTNEPEKDISETLEVSIFSSSIQYQQKKYFEIHNDKVENEIKQVFTLQGDITNKYAGETISLINDKLFVVFWGTAHKERALKAGNEIQNKLKVLNKSLLNSSKISIALDCGKLILRTIRFEKNKKRYLHCERFRICDKILSQVPPGEIYISDDFKKDLNSSLNFNRLDHAIEISGYNKMIHLYHYHND